MAKEIKFTEEEVGKINQLRQDVSNVFTQLGQLAIEKNRRIQEVEKVENELIEKHGNLQNQEKELFESLNEKYGDGNYDPTTNVFTPVEKTESLTVKDILLQPYYAYQMWKMIFEVIFEEKQKKSLTTTSKHVTLYM